MTISWIFYRGHDLESDQHVDAYAVNGHLMVTSESSANKAIRETREHYWGDKCSVTLPTDFLRRAFNFTRDGYQSVLDKWVSNRSEPVLLVRDDYVGTGWMHGCKHLVELWYEDDRILAKLMYDHPYKINSDGVQIYKSLSLRIEVWEDILTGWDEFTRSESWGSITMSKVYEPPISYPMNRGNRWLDG